jgi:hypothetical protein
MTPDDIPLVWRNCLSQFQQSDPTAILAGGSLRDAYCGKIHKDLDFFLTDDIHPSKIVDDYFPAVYGVSARRMKHLPLFPREISTARDAYRNVKYVKSVYELSWHDLNINVIVCEKYPSITEFLESFDFGICQIAYDGKQVICTNAFYWDFKYKLFTMMHGTSFEKSKERFARISKRYEGWQMAMSDVAVVEATKLKFGIRDN